MSELQGHWVPTGMLFGKPSTHEYEYKKVFLAADVEQEFDEVVSTLEVLIKLVPDIGKLSKVQALLARLEGKR